MILNTVKHILNSGDNIAPRLATILNFLSYGTSGHMRNGNIPVQDEAQHGTCPPGQTDTIPSGDSVIDVAFIKKNRKSLIAKTNNIIFTLWLASLIVKRYK